MKNGVKAVLVLAAALGAAGAGMAIGGVAAGALDEDSGIGNNWLARMLRQRTRSYVQVEQDVSSGDSDWGSYNAGDVFAWESFEAEEEFQRIEVTADMADVIVRNADEFLAADSAGGLSEVQEGAVAVRTCKKQGDQSELDMHAENGTLYVSAVYDRETFYQSDDDYPEITLYLPAGVISQLLITSETGDADLAGTLQIGTLETHLGTGDIYVGNDIGNPVRVAEDAILSCEAGDIDAGTLECMGDMQISMDIGDVDLMFASLGGSLDLETGTGEVDMILPYAENGNNQSVYNYNLSTGVGTIACAEWDIYTGGGQGHHEESGHEEHDNHYMQSGVGADLQLTNNPGGSNITVKCGVGDISISFGY